VSGNCLTYNGLIDFVGSHIILDGFEVIRSRGRAIQVLEQAEHNVIRDCWIHDHRNSAIKVRGGSYALISGNTIHSSGNYATYGRSPDLLNWSSAISVVIADHATVSGNVVHDNYGEGISSWRSNYVTIEDNVVYDNMASAIYLNKAGFTTVQRNLVYYTPADQFPTGIALGAESDGRGGFLTDNTVVNNIVIGGRCSIGTVFQTTTAGGLINSTISHNTFVNILAADHPQTTRTICIRPNPANRNTRIEDNIFFSVDAAHLAYVEDTSGISWSHNLWSSAPPPLISGPGDLVADPELKNPYAPLVPGQVVADWYKLQASSPARDAAKAIRGIAEDFFGNVRDDSPDIGAHEFQ
jgi:parallel beta-helix repeat protein